MRFLENNPTLSRQLANPVGRDFIVGDLHGCRALLDGLLAQVSFDTEKDRLFSVGDLVDRGPDSAGCLALLKEPWFYPVLGNHDAMLMAWIYGRTQDKRQRDYACAFTRNKGWQWTKRFTRAAKYLPLLEQIPLVRIVGEGEQRFHVAHAELTNTLSGDSWTDALLDAEGSAIWTQKHFIVGFDDMGTWKDHVLWGRSLILDFKNRAQKGQLLPPPRQEALSRTYVGHTIIPPVSDQGPLEIRSHVFLDSGAYVSVLKEQDGMGLTLWNHTENRGFFMDDPEEPAGNVCASITKAR
ncbi:metallophosphoesterase [Acidithiobacillus thiooxidans]|uniref:metallophosphoesterase n=1 Tax=Acidithiobacillus thiooxidans TaxID=930 RepID=UPI003569EEC6|nr:metallophosphoesterase [Acidithiobacillus sp.]